MEPLNITSLDYNSTHHAKLPIQPFKDKAQTDLFKDPVRTAQ
jgi:hypothetical protein